MLSPQTSGQVTLVTNVEKPLALLAMHLNGAPLSPVYGAHLRLRVENQLGYKMVKWIERIEFIESEKHLARERAARTKTMNISICCPISDAGLRFFLPGP